MDIRMGKTNGLETLRELRKHHPKQLVIMMTAYGTSQTAIEAMKLGAYDYVLKPFDIPKLKSLLFEALKTARESGASPSSPKELTLEDLQESIVGMSAAMQDVYKIVGQAAPTDTTILVTGESGTGKELVARALWQHSGRSNKPFIAINCAAIPEQLLESELFGHEKGAFSGALAQRVGKFEECDGGTLFLDEIGDMPLLTQAKILRVLQDGEISRVGSNQSIRTDVRIIAATNKGLSTSVEQKEFREDLFYRLNVVSIHLPPLRDRQGDIPHLVAFFLNAQRQKQPGSPIRISDDALVALENHSWPGNVRELENYIQRALVLATGDAITLSCLPRDIVGRVEGDEVSENKDDLPKEIEAAKEAPSNRPMDMNQAIDLLVQRARQDKELKLLSFVERELIVRALAETQGNQVQAARLLGITRATLRKRIERFDIERGFSVS